WLALIDEQMAGETLTAYHHRFVWLDESCVLRSVSRPFSFIKRGAEFSSGLAWHHDGKRLIVRYGLDDRNAWLATLDAAEVRAALEDAERLPSGAPSQAGGNPVAIPAQLPPLALAAAAVPVER